MWVQVAQAALQHARRDPWEQCKLEQKPAERVKRYRLEAVGRLDAGLGDLWEPSIAIQDEDEEKVDHYKIVPGAKWTVDMAVVKVEEIPFAEGAMRKCFRMKKLPQDPTNHSVHALDWKHAHNYVAKIYKKEASRQRYFEDVVMQEYAAHWAHQYNLSDPQRELI